MPTLLIKKIRSDAVTPTRGTEQSSGLDITILGIAKVLSEDVALYSTGLQATIKEPGYDIKIYPRSSISKTPYVLANSVAVIDSDYRGELFIALRKVAEGPDLEFPVKIAQLIIEKVHTTKIVEVDDLDSTKRGEGGFGSTDAVAVVRDILKNNV